MISRIARIAIGLTARIAINGQDAVPVTTLARQTGVPQSTCTTTLAPLIGAGILTARKGRAGGYALAKPTTAITLADIASAVDPAALRPLPSDEAMNTALSGLTAISDKHLSSTTLDDFVAALTQPPILFAKAA